MLPIFRRDLRNGFTVVVSLVTEAAGRVRAILQLERRDTPVRRDGHAPPTLAESRGSTQQEALDALMHIANDDAELARRMAEWEDVRERGRRHTPPMAGDRQR